MAAALSPDDRRAQILRTAVQLAQREPLDEALSIERVARDAGVSQPLIYHYFKNKNGFRTAVLTACADAFVARYGRPDPGLHPARQLRQGLETWADLVASRPDLHFAVLQLLGSPKDVRSLQGRHREAIADYIGETLAGHGIERSPELHVTLLGWQGFVEEVALAWTESPRMSRTAMLDLCEAALYGLLRGLGVDAQAYGLELASSG